MYPSFTYPELQERFCEGFAFFPFQALEQHGSYIFKRYAAGDNTAGLLDRYNRLYNAGYLHAELLLMKLQQRDIPIAAELLRRLQSGRSHLEERCRGLKRRPIIVKQLMDSIDGYSRVLTVYQNQVQQQLLAQLTELSAPNSTTSYEGVNAENLGQISSIVQEFLHSSEIIYGFLYGCIRQLPGFKRLRLTVSEQEDLQTIMKTINEFRNLQQKTIYMLEQWAQEGAQHREQRIMN
jgi:hypothetical protein